MTAPSRSSPSAEVEGAQNGSWLGPTIIAGVTPSMTCYREEIFDPVDIFTVHDVLRPCRPDLFRPRADHPVLPRAGRWAGVGSFPAACSLKQLRNSFSFFLLEP